LTRRAYRFRGDLVGLSDRRQAQPNFMALSKTRLSWIVPAIRSHHGPVASTASILLPFGSAHTEGCYMAFSDGSIQLINYSIDKTTHGYLGNRKDGRTIDPKKL
jgi:hypothetical protein